jgi:hypothetical protein
MCLCGKKNKKVTEYKTIKNLPHRHIEKQIIKKAKDRSFALHIAGSAKTKFSM